MGTRDERENSHVATRLTPGQIETIDACAEQCGMSRSAWIRAILLAAAGVSPLQDQIEKGAAGK